MLANKKILLGVTGSISAYKSAYLVREFVKNNCEVKVIMTKAATGFISPVTLSTLSKNPVYQNYIASESTGTWNNHIELALWADVALFAPCSANTLSKLAAGACNNFLTATALSLRCPLFVAPAMDVDMYKHPATQHNLKVLREREVHIINPDSGELASGLSGEGRLREPDEIVDLLKNFFSQKRTLAGKTFLITAGPTYEALDPVRFLGNRSSGKTGIALGDELASRGAQVHLIQGPGNAKARHPEVKTTRVQSAREMLAACQKVYPQCQGAVFAAAVSDYRPAEEHEQKLKKESGTPEVKLIENPDIAGELGALKKQGVIHAGFALETQHGVENARKKLKKKNFDLIVLNSPGKNTGFEHDTNQITVITHNNSKSFELKTKTEAAKDIVDEIQLHFT